MAQSNRGFQLYRVSVKCPVCKVPRLTSFDSPTPAEFKCTGCGETYERKDKANANLFAEIDRRLSIHKATTQRGVKHD